jgi:hypothetical protein
MNQGDILDAVIALLNPFPISTAGEATFDAQKPALASISGMTQDTDVFCVQFVFCPSTCVKQLLSQVSTWKLPY